MNRESRLRLICIFLLFALAVLESRAQEQSLSQYIEQIESNSDFVFNYDVVQTDGLSSEFQLNGDYSLEKLTAFFASTALDIQINGRNIIVLPLRKRKFKLCGKIESAVDQQPLSYASVFVNSQGASTDDHGNFSFELEAYKNELCNISYLGFEKKSVALLDLAECPTIKLSSSDFLLSNSIVVRSYLKRGIEEGRSYGGLNLDFSRTSKDLNLFRQDFFRTLQNLPGIDSPDDSAVNLSIRGGTPDHNLVSWEGVTLYDRGYLFGMISSINPFNIEKVAIYKSNHSALVDNKIGGVVQMYLPDKVPEQISGSVGLNLTEGFADVHVPIINDKLSLLISGRKSLFGVWPSSPTYSSYTQKVFGSETELQNEEEEESIEEGDLQVDFQDLNAKLILQATPALKFQSSWFLSSSENRNVSSYNALELSTRDAITSNTSAFSNRLAWGVNKQDTLELSHTYSTFEEQSELSYSQTNDDTDLLRREESNSIKDQQFRLGYSLGKSDRRTSLGYILDEKSVEVETEDYSNSQTESERSSSNNGVFHHFYAQQVLGKKKLFLELGSRASYSAQLAKVYFSPSASLRYKLSRQLRLKASAGIYHQFIRQVYEPIDNNLSLENAIWQLDTKEGSPVLNARKASAGFVLRQAGWLVDVEAFYHQTRGLSAQNPNIRNFVEADINNQINSSGLDLLINKRFGNFSSSLFYSLADYSLQLSVVEVEEDEEEEEEEETRQFPANNNQLHNLKLMTSYKLRKWELRLAYYYKSGLPLSDQNALMEDDEDEDEYELEYVAFNNSQLADYHRVDLSLLYSQPLKWGNYELGFSLMNLLNRKNEGSRKYLVAETNGNTESPEVLEITKTLLPFTANVHARLYW